jgi:hypothetical protein
MYEVGDEVWLRVGGKNVAATILEIHFGKAERSQEIMCKFFFVGCAFEDYWTGEGGIVGRRLEGKSWTHPHAYDYGFLGDPPEDVVHGVELSKKLPLYLGWCPGKYYVVISYQTGSDVNVIGRSRLEVGAASRPRTLRVVRVAPPSPKIEISWYGPPDGAQ